MSLGSRPQECRGWYWRALAARQAAHPLPVCAACCCLQSRFCGATRWWTTRGCWMWPSTPRSPGPSPPAPTPPSACLSTPEWLRAIRAISLLSTHSVELCNEANGLETWSCEDSSGRGAGTWCQHGVPGDCRTLRIQTRPARARWGMFKPDAFTFKQTNNMPLAWPVPGADGPPPVLPSKQESPEAAVQAAKEGSMALQVRWGG